jgi:uncharacterized protein YceK
MLEPYKKDQSMKKLNVLLLMAALPGCASIIDGSSQQINIQPSTTAHGRVDAEDISRAGTQTVRLPAVITVKRSSKDIIVKVNEDDNPCFEETRAVIPSSFNFVVLANIITGGTLGSTTDGLTGAMWQYDDAVIVPLEAKQGCKAKNKSE